MKSKIYPALALCLLLSIAVFGQKLEKPTITPTEVTPAQKSIINEGIALHDQKQFDAAIARYEQVLKENPTSDLALYEMALSYYNKKDFKKATELGYKLVQYKSNTGTMGYGLIANMLDDQGKPKEAFKIYQSAIKQLENDPAYKPQLASLYYNLGITYTREKLFKESRDAMKKAVENDFLYASPHYVLAMVYHGTKYRVPALLAAARLISLELNTQRTKQSVAVFLDVLNSGKKDEKTGNLSIMLDFDAPKDEGEFGMYDLLLGTLTTVKGDEDKNKSEIEIFSDAVGTVISLLEEDKKLSSTFVGKTYIPFMAEMKKRGHTKTFAYLVLQQNGNLEAEKWLLSNSQQTSEFLSWAKSYQLK